ncbi:MAG: TIGR04076 family protein [Bacilli bacterium]|nr:TIGR04076 family protein [Bacilli bacterium]
MKPVRITVVRISRYQDLIEKYENPIQHACSMEEGMSFVSHAGEMPSGFCASAWGSILPFVSSLIHEQGDFYEGWMKNPLSAMISCNDGFRPVSFYLETID